MIDQLEDYDLLDKVSPKISKQIAAEKGACLVVSTGSVTTMSKKRQETIHHDYMKSLTYFGVMPAEQASQYEYFVYITRNIKLNVLKCHVYNVNVGDGKEIVDTITARKKALDLQQQAIDGQVSLVSKIAIVTGSPSEATFPPSTVNRSIGYPFQLP